MNARRGFMKLRQPILHTQHLDLRPIKLTDVDAVFEYAKDERVGPNAGWKPHTDKEESRSFIKFALQKRDFHQPGIYAIIYRKKNKMIGTIEIHSYKEFKGELGFVLHPKYWNKGFATEAAKAIIVYGFEVLGLRRLAYGHFLFNEPSKRVCEKLGFTYEGTLRNKYLQYNGDVIDEAIYSITSEEFFHHKIPWVLDFKKTLKVDYDLDS